MQCVHNIKHDIAHDCSTLRWPRVEHLTTTYYIMSAHKPSTDTAHHAHKQRCAVPKKIQYNPKILSSAHDTLYPNSNAKLKRNTSQSGQHCRTQGIPCAMCVLKSSVPKLILRLLPSTERCPIGVISSRTGHIANAHTQQNGVCAWCT